MQKKILVCFLMAFQFICYGSNKGLGQKEEILKQEGIQRMDIDGFKIGQTTSSLVSIKPASYSHVDLGEHIPALERLRDQYACQAVIDPVARAQKELFDEAIAMLTKSLGEATIAESDKKRRNQDSDDEISYVPGQALAQHKLSRNTFAVSTASRKLLNDLQDDPQATNHSGDESSDFGVETAMDC